jgi:hypothetical protein
MLMEKVSVAFSVLMIPFMPGFMPEYMSDQADWDFWF